MDQESWKAVDGCADVIAEELDQLLESSAISEIKELLGKLGGVLSGSYGASLNVSVDILDSKNEVRHLNSLRIVTTGISATGDGGTYRTYGDSSPQRYLVDGEIQVAPHDHCPKCWGDWDFKLEHRSCPSCDAQLGRDCKILLDSDVCPHCEVGKITMQNPKCEKCGFEVEPSVVAWG